MEAQETVFLGGPFDGGSTEETAEKLLISAKHDSRWSHGYTMKETKQGVRYIYTGIYDAKTRKKWRKDG
jgi:hypothetical protein